MGQCPKNFWHFTVPLFSNVLILEFNKYGILKEKQLLKKDDIEKLTFAKNTTTNKLTQLSFVEKLLSSLRQKMYSGSGK